MSGFALLGHRSARGLLLPVLEQGSRDEEDNGGSSQEQGWELP